MWQELGHRKLYRIGYQWERPRRLKLSNEVSNRLNLYIPLYSHSKGEALQPEAPRRYGSGNGFPRVTESAVTKILGVGRPAMGIAFPA